MALTSFFSGGAVWANSFQYRDFRLLWGSTLLHAVGMGMEQVAIGWLVLEMTDSPFMVGVAGAARMAPFFFLGFVSGAVADRVDRRIFLRFINIGGSAIAAIMATLLILDVIRVWHVILLAGATGVFWAFLMTVRQSYTYDIVGPEHALNGMSLSAMGQRIGGVVGSVVAGILIATSGVGGQYIAVAASYAAAFAILLGTRNVGQAAPAQREPVFKNLVGYIQILRENSTLRTLMLLTAATEVFGFTHQTLLPVFARDVLGVGSIGLGIMTAVRQGGGVLGLMLLANLGDFRRKGLVMFLSAIGFGLGQMGLYLASNIFVFIVVLSFIAACASSADTLYKTLMQANVPNEQRGRAMGSWVLSIGVAPVGHIGIGGMAGALGAPGAILINGSILALISIATMLGLPKIRRLE